ncbi:uncharacterized protein Tco025E_09167 [Trypanosoma conorhini]|uniref:Uncharacterized protein n=1 Tax=Trypanosoma conorhini TaxID=83891 RepID=A0A3R7N228_9TRYP|nr:uncharacterized protein Tco025E_09167 [Trypanosoma conorhini]RNE98775.1 hypothetical protein Tco025E_09167 [Trypanosoma conorhini]
MSEQSRNDWGEMVLPGVYMLRGCTAPSQGRLVGVDASRPQLEFILEAIEVMERHTSKLKESNEEIRRYLRNPDSVMESTNALSTSTSEVAVCEAEDVNSILAAALQENEALISRKERELNELKQLVQNNRCACSYHSTQETNVNHLVPADAGGNHVAPDVREATDEMSNAHFSL